MHKSEDFGYSVRWMPKEHALHGLPKSNLVDLPWKGRLYFINFLETVITWNAQTLHHSFLTLFSLNSISNSNCLPMTRPFPITLLLTKLHPSGQRYPVLKYHIKNILKNVSVINKTYLFWENTMTLKGRSISYSGPDVVVVGVDVVKTDPDPPAA